MYSFVLKEEACNNEKKTENKNKANMFVLLNAPTYHHSLSIAGTVLFLPLLALKFISSLALSLLSGIYSV